MDQIKIGKFILKIRKKLNLTQQEFANRLAVTAQAVSKWENGRGLPDIEMLKLISEEFKVDISELLAGEKKKPKLNFVWLVLLVVMLGALFFGCYRLFNRNRNAYQYLNLSSKHESFNLKGIAVFSHDKKSIYISNIEYVNENNKNDKYTVIECSLYETDNVIDKKIDQCGDINNAVSENEPVTLSEFLQTVEFNLYDYDANCKNLALHELYITISAKDINNKTNYYKVPIKLEEKCS